MKNQAILTMRWRHIQMIFALVLNLAAFALFVLGYIGFRDFALVALLTNLCCWWLSRLSKQEFLKACDEYYEHFGERYENDPRKDEN